MQSESLEKSNQVHFDLYLHLEKLLLSGNELEIEYNNLISFPVKLIGNYIDNISFSFSDSIKTNIENCMSIQFLHNESDVIHQSIQHLTQQNQKEILSNSQFFQLSPLEVKTILGTTSHTPSQQFLQSHQALTNKQSQKGNLDLSSKKSSYAQELSRQTSQQSKVKNKLVEQPQNQREVSLENVDRIVAELSQYRQKNIVPQLRESSLNKDRLLLSNLENQREFQKFNNLNGSMFNSVVINSYESDRQNQIYPFFTETDSISRANLDNSTSNGMLIINQFTNSPQQDKFLAQYSDIKIEGSEFKRKQYPSVHDNCKLQALLEKEISSDLRKSQVSTNSKTNNNNNNTKQEYSINSRLAQTPQTNSRSRSPIRLNEIESTNNNNNAHNYEIKSARSHYTYTTEMNQSRDNFSYLKRSLTPNRNNTQNQIDSQGMNKSLISTNGLQNIQNAQYVDLSKTLPSRGGQEDGYSQSSMNASHTDSYVKPSKRITHSSKNNSLKFIKSPTKTNGAKSTNNDRTSPISSRKPSTNTYKKKSEKLQIIISKLRLNQYIDHIELVSEDVNDQECEELGGEIGKTKITIDSIKLVKNKISDVGLKAILQGLEKGGQNIHTLNLTSNLCSENCFDDILKYLNKNSSLQNIYLLNNNIQIYKNKDKLKTIQQLCNIHI